MLTNLGAIYIKKATYQKHYKNIYQIMETLPLTESKLKYKIKPKLAELTEVKRVKVKGKILQTELNWWHIV